MNKADRKTQKGSNVYSDIEIGKDRTLKGSNIFPLIILY